MEFAVSTASCAGMQRSQRNTKQWIEAVARHMNLSPSALSLASGMAASTVTRYLNDRTNTVGISQTSLDKLSAYSGVPVHRMPGETPTSGMQPDAIALEQSELASDRLRRAVNAFGNGSNSVFSLEMRGWVLDLQGILPGDVMVFDMDIRPSVNDVVCVGQTDLATGAVNTLIRIFRPPTVIAHSAKLGPINPLMVDEDKVIVKGVMIGVVRTRH